MKFLNLKPTLNHPNLPAFDEAAKPDYPTVLYTGSWLSGGMETRNLHPFPLQNVKEVGDDEGTPRTRYYSATISADCAFFCYERMVKFFFQKGQTINFTMQRKFEDVGFF